MQFSSRFIILLSILPGFFLLPANAGNEVDVTPLKTWIEKQSKLKTLKAEFTQERKVRTLRKPLKSEGLFWFKAPGTFRWQAGDPPTLLAIQKEKQDFYVLKPKKKSAEVYKYEGLREKESNNGLAFLDMGFPGSYAEFEKSFNVKKIEKLSTQFVATLSLKNRKQAIVLRKLMFYLDQKTHALVGIRLFFRDGSIVTNSFKNITNNATIPDSLFVPDLKGYKLKEKKK